MPYFGKPKLLVFNKSGGGGSGSLVTGGTDNAILRADGVGGSTSQGSLATIDDNGAITIPDGQGLIIGVKNVIAANASFTSCYLNSSNISTMSIGSSAEVRIGNSSIPTVWGYFTSSKFAVPLGSQINFSATANDASQAADSGFARVAAKVLRLTDGGANKGWLQFEGYKRVTNAVTNATATMSNISDLTINVQAGRKYSGSFSIIAKNSTAAEGLQFDFNGGTATVASVQFYINGSPVGVTIGVANSNALATALTATTATTTDRVYEICFDMVVNAAGTIIPRFAEVSHTSGTATVEAGSASYLNDMP